ncbi:MAG TPA: LPS assembly lipoprotein LptE [Gemmatimonadales bacterium]|jgi:curli biogenesis system outer membrane secretion channel CsgG|nr:LPS assembly lipoprotein LptE [Gemmatimonadales bacterium]
MRRAISSVLALLVAGCSVGFAGGGFPPGVHTVAILPFDNQTTEPTLAQQVNLAVKQALVSRLGLRAAAEGQADAVVHGTITRYDPDEPAAYHGQPGATGTPNQVVVTRRQVEIYVDLDVVNQHTGNPIISLKGVQVIGDYDPGQVEAGKTKALGLLVDRLVTEAHSKW